MTDELTVNRKGKASLAPTIAHILIIGAIGVQTITSCSSGDEPSDGGDVGGGNVVYGTPVTYEDETYKTVVIGTQTWMAKNLNYDAEGSKCSDNDNANCSKYGRLYDWVAAMALPSDCDSTECSSQISVKHQGICPSGWHIPSDEDWNRLFRYVDDAKGGYGYETFYATVTCYNSRAAGSYLKATSGWYNCGTSGSGNSYLCEDSYGFSALPGGNGNSDGGFGGTDYHGYWWSANESNSNSARSRFMNYGFENALAVEFSKGKSNLFSVRCLQD